MCNQTASLIARALEETGIATVTISLLKEISLRVLSPRALFVPYGFGFPLGEANNRDLQDKILRACLSMLTSATQPGEIWEFGD